MATKYISPTAVVSPKRYWSLITVLEDNGPGGSALALGRWENSPVLALRWNGDNEDNPIGNPQSRGLATWFVVPDKYREFILQTLSSDKLTLARNFLPKPTK
ncbi:MAG TPA: hypothetical protein VM008_06145 [Phycisphaerae bacterium]|nr:hypothetical protein [Phycisphaerae bacterium]